MAALFLVLKKARQSVDEAHAIAARAIQDGADDRTHATALARDPFAWNRGDSTNGINLEELQRLCIRAIEERAELATVLENIRRDLEHVNIVPRTRNVGQKARGAKKTLP